MEWVLQAVGAVASRNVWCPCPPDSGSGELLYWLVALGLPLALIVVGTLVSARRHGREQPDDERHEKVRR